MNTILLIISLVFAVTGAVMIVQIFDRASSQDIPSCCPQLETPKYPLVVPPPQILVSPRVGK